MRQNWRFTFMFTRHAPFKQDEITGDLSACDSIVVSRIWRILMVEDLQQIHGKRKSRRTISRETWLTFNPYQRRKIKEQRGKIAWSLPNSFLSIWKKPKKEDVWPIKNTFEKLRSLSERSNNYRISHFIFCGLFDDEQ